MIAERVFSASYDSTSKAVSALVCLALLVVAWLVHIVYLALLFPLLIGLAYAYSPRGYLLSGDALVIRRLIGNIRVPLAGVRELRPGTPDDLTGCIRLWGNGGLFGYFGLFRTAKLGKCHWYVTNRAKTVIVVTQNKTLVLSPDDVQDFVRTAGVPSTAASSGIPAQFHAGSAGGNLLGKVFGFGIAALVLTVISFAVFYSPGPPAYTLTADRLTIHDKFYPVTLQLDSIDAAHIRIVDLSQDPEWRLTARTNGFANQNYQSGWFRAANGKTLRLYRAGGKRLVLIPPRGEGAFVLYQARDPEGFARELAGARAQ